MLQNVRKTPKKLTNHDMPAKIFVFGENYDVSGNDVRKNFCILGKIFCI